MADGHGRSPQEVMAKRRVRESCNKSIRQRRTRKSFVKISGAMSVNPTSCPERSRLSRAVTHAVEAVHEAKIQLDRVMQVLSAATQAEATAMAELESHRKEHGC
jgi:hypothetical protein